MGNKQEIALANIFMHQSREADIRKLFSKYDIDKNGKLSRDEFKDFLKEVMIVITDDYDKSPDLFNFNPDLISSEKLDELIKRKEIAKKLSDFDSYDTNKDNVISYEEFKTHISILAKQQKQLEN